MSNLAASSAQTPRISSKVRAAIEARVRQGLSLAEAAKAADMSRNGLAKALKRPAVQAHLRDVQAVFVAEVAASRSVYPAHALRGALDLMLNAKSETVRARMVEFLAGEGNAPHAAVRVDARQVVPGYHPVPPRLKVVEKKGAY